jgi:hypothetical protein
VLNITGGFIAEVVIYECVYNYPPSATSVKKKEGTVVNSIQQQISNKFLTVKIFMLRTCPSDVR